WIEAFIIRRGEDVLTLDVESRSARQPPRAPRRNRITQLQITEPDVRSVRDVEIAELRAEGIVLIDSRVLGVRIRRRPRIVEQVLADVRLELAEHVELLLVLEDVVPEASEERHVQIEVSATHAEIQAGREIRVGIPDDGPVRGVDESVAVRVLELEPARSGPVLTRRSCAHSRNGIGRVCIRFSLSLEISIGHEAIERTDRV